MSNMTDSNVMISQETLDLFKKTLDAIPIKMVFADETNTCREGKLRQLEYVDKELDARRRKLAIAKKALQEKAQRMPIQNPKCWNYFHFQDVKKKLGEMAMKNLHREKASDGVIRAIHCQLELKSFRPDIRHFAPKAYSKYIQDVQDFNDSYEHAREYGHFPTRDRKYTADFGHDSFGKILHEIRGNRTSRHSQAKANMENRLFQEFKKSKEDIDGRFERITNFLDRSSSNDLHAL